MRSPCMPIFFGVPSCVPATDFETAGASLDSTAVARLLEDDRFRYLSEMMNWPGVLQEDPEVMAKVALIGGSENTRAVVALTGWR